MRNSRKYNEINNCLGERPMGIFVKKAVLGFVVMIVFATFIAAVGCGSVQNEIDPSQNKEVQILKDALEKERGFVRIHAAEALLNHGFHDLVLREFLPENSTAEPMYRVGVWRVLAQANPKDRNFRYKYIDCMVNVFKDVNAPERILAAESEVLSNVVYDEMITRRSP